MIHARGDLRERGHLTQSLTARSRSVSLGAAETGSSRSLEGRAAERSSSDGSGCVVAGRQSPGASPQAGGHPHEWRETAEPRGTMSQSGPPVSPSFMSRISKWQAAVEGTAGSATSAGVPPMVRSDSDHSLTSEASFGKKDWAWLGSSFAADSDSGAVSVFAQRRHRCVRLCLAVCSCTSNLFRNLVPGGEIAELLLLLPLIPTRILIQTPKSISTHAYLKYRYAYKCSSFQILRPVTRVGPRRTYGYARRVSRFLVQVFLGISIWFFCFLQGIGLLSKLQKVEFSMPSCWAPDDTQSI